MVEKRERYIADLEERLGKAEAERDRWMAKYGEVRAAVRVAFDLYESGYDDDGWHDGY